MLGSTTYVVLRVCGFPFDVHRAASSVPVLPACALQARHVAGEQLAGLQV